MKTVSARFRFPGLPFVRAIRDMPEEKRFSFNKSENYEWEIASVLLPVHLELAFDPTISGLKLPTYEEAYKRMFFTFGEVKRAQALFLPHTFSSSLFDVVAAFKSHALPVAFSTTRLLDGTYQTDEYVLMYEA